MNCAFCYNSRFVYSIIDILTSEQFGRAVHDARKRAGLTQAEAAALCGVSTPFQSHLENGKATIQLEKALHVARQLGLHLVFDGVLDDVRRGAARP